MALCFAALATLCGLEVSAGESVGGGALATSAAAKAAAVLETHCARCHQAGRLAPGGQPTLLLNILDLADVAHDPSLVRPGLPDGSPLYTAMLRRWMPPDAEREGRWTGPTADDLQAVRNWIDALPERPPGDCARRPAPQAGVAIATALWRLNSAAAAASRFITLTHLDAACAGAQRMAKHGDALRRLIVFLSRTRPGATLEPVGTGGTVFRISLDALGWTAAEWERLVADDPLVSALRGLQEGFDVAVRITGSAAPVVRGDWLAHAVLRRGVPPGSALEDEDGSIAALARAWERPLDLETAAAEMAIDRDELAQLLESAPAAASVPARRLLQGVLPRTELLNLQAALRGTAGTPADAGRPRALEIAVWSDKPAYRTGDLLTLHSWSSADCHLTLISLDRDGRATVLFPNEMETNNLLAAGHVLTVPGAEAGYQFRLADAGRERVVGVCTAGAGPADGIQPDYERQRFTMLGDWRAFLNRRWSESVSPKERQTRVARRRGRRPEAQVSMAPPSPEHHARTAIMFEVR